MKVFGAYTAAIFGFYGLGYLFGRNQPLSAEQLEEIQQNQDICHTKADPVIPNIQLISYPNFRIIYSTHLKIPLAVHELINQKKLIGKSKRSDNFFEQPQIEQKWRGTEKHFKKTQAYKNLNLSRGHMAAAGDYGDQKAKDDTFTYANIVPQDSDNNADTWLTFQSYQRQLVKHCQSVEVISGPIFLPKSEEPISKVEYSFLGTNGIAVPTHLYKIIKCNLKDTSYASGFVFKNSPSNDGRKKLKEFEVPIQKIQQKTGLVFNLKKPGSLTEYDSPVFDLTKKEFNKNILYPKIMKSKSYEELSSELWKVKSHKLGQVDPKIVQKIRSMVGELRNGEACDMVSQALTMKKDLRRNLYLQEEIQKDIMKVVDQKWSQCLDMQKRERIEKQMSQS